MADIFVKNRVSIVTPVRNGERYLSRMLDSVLGQSYRELEMILVDGEIGRASCRERVYREV